MNFLLNEERLELCCKMLIAEVLKQKEQQGIKTLSFKTGFFYQNEGYKAKVYNKGRQKLMLHTWTTEDIGSGYIFQKVMSAVNQSSNLVDWHTMSIKDKVNRSMYDAEKLFYRFFKQSEAETVFDELTEFLGGKYDFMSYLMFLKDCNKYLPCVPTKFAQRLRFMGITTSCVNSCSWAQYQEFIEIIKVIQRNIKPLFPSVDVSLLDAHSFAWSMYLLEEKLDMPDPEFEDFAKGQLDISAEEWTKLLQSGTFETDQIERIIEVYKYPNHSVTCKELGDDNEVHPSSFISPFVAIAKKALEFFNMNAPKRETGENTFWPVLFLGRRLSNGLFEWKIRNELVLALEKADLAPQYMKEIIEHRAEVDNLEAPKADYQTLLNAIRKSPYKKVEVADVTVKRYNRDPRIREIVKLRSEGNCDWCQEPAPFQTKSGEPYLECHHVVPLAEGGTDTLDNVVALCPNCHRRIHAIGEDEDIQTLLDTIADYLRKEKTMEKA